MAEEETSVELGSYEGYPILESAIVVNKLGDGLSDAVSVEPVSIGPNDVAHIAVRVRKTKDRYEFIRDKKTNKILGVRWVQVFDSTGAAFADNQVIKGAVNKMSEKIAEKKALEKDQLSLGINMDDPNLDNITHLPNARKHRDEHKEVADKVDDAFRDKK